MLGYVTADDPGRADRLIHDAAKRLEAAGLVLAGAVQINRETEASTRCHMDLQILGDSGVVRISQSLGPLSQGCRLDLAALTDAVGHVAARLRQDGLRPDRLGDDALRPLRLGDDALRPAPQILILNKFAKQEAEGRGFRSLIGDALSDGLPVLTAVGKGHEHAFLAFAGDLAQPVPGDLEAVVSWAMAAARPRR